MAKKRLSTLKTKSNISLWKTLVMPSLYLFYASLLQEPMLCLGQQCVQLFSLLWQLQVAINQVWPMKFKQNFLDGAPRKIMLSLLKRRVSEWIILLSILPLFPPEIWIWCLEVKKKTTFWPWENKSHMPVWVKYQERSLIPWAPAPILKYHCWTRHVRKNTLIWLRYIVGFCYVYLNW